MDEQLHIIVTGDRGKVLRLPFTRKKLRLVLVLSTLALLLLAVTSIFSISFYTKYHNYDSHIAKLKEQLREKKKIITDQDQQNQNLQLQLDLKAASFELNNLKQEAAFKAEKELLISNAVSELNERSELIKEIVGSIGIKLPKESKEVQKSSGGLFIPKPDDERDELLDQADKYLKTIRYLPLGRPAKGSITSHFGKRRDPLNNKKAFHTGVDIRGKKGDKIYATADGVVIKAFRNGGYGNYIKISHKNGYTTSFSHMQAYLVKKGEKVARGQLIGLIGNTGRSTGPHLHYEVALNGKPINPYDFMKTDKFIK